MTRGRLLGVQYQLGKCWGIDCKFERLLTLIENGGSLERLDEQWHVTSYLLKAIFKSCGRI